MIAKAGSPPIIENSFTRHSMVSMKKPFTCLNMLMNKTEDMLMKESSIIMILMSFYLYQMFEKDQRFF